jgi:hypothetical protein
MAPPEKCSENSEFVWWLLRYIHSPVQSSGILAKLW